MKTKILIGLLLLVVVSDIIFGVKVLALKKAQPPSNQLIQNNGLLILSTPTLKEMERTGETKLLKTRVDHSGFNIRLHSGFASEKSQLYGTAPPSELLFINPHGRKVGNDPQTKKKYNEIPNAFYEAIGLEDAETGDTGPFTYEIDIRQPIAGDYQLQVIGTDTGTYTLETVAYDPDLNPSGANFENVSIAPGEIHTYGFYYAKTVGIELEFKAVPGNFDGKGQRPSDVNKFLSYVTPTQSTTTLPAETTSFSLIIIYDKNIIPSTFTAELNGADVKSLFHPSIGDAESVTLNMRQGRNTLVLSVEGNLPNRTARDTDRLVFLVV